MNHLARQLENQKKMEQKQRLEVEYGLVGHAKAELLYEMSWGMGHYAGFEEVSIHYRDLAQLLK